MGPSLPTAPDFGVGTRRRGAASWPPPRRGAVDEPARPGGWWARVRLRPASPPGEPMDPGTSGGAASAGPAGPVSQPGGAGVAA